MKSVLRLFRLRKKNGGLAVIGPTTIWRDITSNNQLNVFVVIRYCNQYNYYIIDIEFE